MISHQHKFVFVHPPKVAGNTIHNVLLPYYDLDCKITDNHIGEKQGFSVSELYKHATIAEILKKFPKVKGYRKISVIRNPWDRVASFYFWKMRYETSERSFKSWFNETWDGELKPLTHWFTHKRKMIIDDLIRFEHLDEDLTRIYKDVTGETLQLIPKLNQSGKPPYQELYKESGKWDEEMIELVRHHFAEDLKFGSYQFESR